MYPLRMLDHSDQTSKVDFSEVRSRTLKYLSNELISVLTSDLIIYPRGYQIMAWFILG